MATQEAMVAGRDHASGRAKAAMVGGRTCLVRNVRCGYTTFLVDSNHNKPLAFESALSVPRDSSCR